MSEYKTRNDLSANAKSESINILNAHLADSIDLALPTKQAHWNIKELKNRSSQRMLRETILAWLAVCVTFGAFSISIYNQWERAEMSTTVAVGTIDSTGSVSSVAAMPAPSSSSQLPG